MDSLSEARAVLESAQSSLDEAMGQLQSTADGPVSAAREMVQGVFSAGFELDGINSLIGRIEEAGNEIHAMVGTLQSIKDTIDDVKG